MTEKKWTTGPWTVDVDDITASIIARDGELVVAGEYNGWMAPFACRDEGVSNANLIATAPELYEALENLLYAMKLEHPHTTFPEAEKALAKARGES